MNPIYLEIIVVCLGIFLLLFEAFLPVAKRKCIAVLAILGLLGTFALTFFVDPSAIDPNAAYAKYYAVDRLALFFKQFSLLGTLVVLVSAIDYRPILQRYIPASQPGAGVGEFFTVPLFTCAGLMWLVSATDFVSIFVSLELVTVSFYVIVPYMRRNTGCLEAGVKYLILGALSTGFIVYGIAWIFGASGTINLLALQQRLPSLESSHQLALLFGLAMVLVSIGFKISAFPFQFWVPDVYQGAPTPVTAFLSVSSKAAGFVVLIRVLQPFLVVPVLEKKVLLVVGFMAAGTMIFGNLAALPQTNFKRLLSYSSIAHAGYLLMGVASAGAALAGPGIVFYLTAYFIMTFLAFAVTIAVTRATGGDDIANFNGLGRRSPALAFLMTVAVMGLAGIPFTAGFLGKFFIFEAAITRGLYPLVVIGVISVACGFYYYFKVIRAMYWQPAEGESERFCLSPVMWVAAVILVILTFVLGVYPEPILGLFF